MANELQQNPEKIYLYIWKFSVRPDKEAEFQMIYGSGGEWVQLFKQGIGHIQTLLVKDLDADLVYTTIDMWESESAFKAFKAEFAAEFEAIDKRCEHLTENEVLIGRFECL
jgi:heme-degrading monooxygenase HmoA